MNEENKKRWLIRDPDGRVRGPFYTDEILRKIASGTITGEEMIALYPGTDWIAISKDPDFYDKLLSSLENEPHRSDQLTPNPNYKDIDDETVEDFVVSGPRSATKTPNLDPTTTHSKIKSHAEKVTRPQVPKDSAAEQEEESLPERAKRFKEKIQEALVIELQKKSKALKSAKLRQSRSPILLGLIVLLGVGYFLFSDEEQDANRVRLLAPRLGGPAISADKSNSLLKSAVQEFVQDQYDNYLAAQDKLVQALEGDPKNSAAIALLCLSHLELWPYAHQDTKDLSTINQVTLMASKVDPAGIEAATCRVVDLLVRDKIIEAKGVTEMILDTYGGTGQPPTAFYYFKARVFDVGQEYAAAASYLKSAQQLWPQWIRAYSYEGEVLFRLKDYNAAASRFRAVIKANPKHTVAKINLGVLEYKYLSNPVQGKMILEASLAGEQKAPRPILSIGYLALAEMALSEGRTSRALDYARKSYVNNSQQMRAKEIILQVGGAKSLSNTKVSDSQLVFEGDQLVRENDCNGAQAVYKAAFELNKKNALAAMKAGECLWQLSLSTEAIDWLNKATKADPNLIDAYVLLADFYSLRFNYTAAAEVLVRARSVSPNSHKVYKGYALIELRRFNYSGAANFAEKAIQFYEADVESYIILARAQMSKNETAKAFDTASKAIELDLNNREAQIVYAETLAATRGVNVGLDYLNRLVSTYPTATEFRLALGKMYNRDQQYTSAQTVLEQVIKLDEKPKAAYVELAKTFQFTQRYEAALAAYIKAASLDPADVEPLFLAGQLYLETKKSSEARQQFQRVLRVNRDYPLVNYYIGKAALQMQSYEEALQEAKIEKSKNPNLADPYLLAAEAYTEMKQYTLCASEYQQAVKLRPQGASIYVKMARCYRMSGNLDAAVSMINQAGFQESGNPEVWKEQGSIYETRNESIKAIEAYQQYLVLAPNAPDRDIVQSRINSLSQ